MPLELERRCIRFAASVRRKGNLGKPLKTAFFPDIPRCRLRQSARVLKTVSVERLRLGMYVHQLSGHWLDNPFWRTRFVLSDPADLAKIQGSGMTAVVIDTALGLDDGDEAELSGVRPGAPATPSCTVPRDEGMAGGLLGADRPLPETHPSLRHVGKTYEAAVDVGRRAIQQVMGIYDAARLGRAVDAREVLPVVEEIVESVHEKPHALISIARLKRLDDYTYSHAVAVCALMIRLARQMGHDDVAVRDAGLAGLLLDVGKAALAEEILQRPAQLTPQERQEFRKHPVLGHRLLLEDGGYGRAVLEACLYHHERPDGSGYPEGREGDAIPLIARMAAVCDVYDAVTSRRPYRAPWDPGEAMRQMALSKGALDAQVFHHFVKSVGIYPVGSLVRLKSERLGVVMRQHSASLLTPLVRVFYSLGASHRVEPYVLDLSSPNSTDKIVGVESQETWNFGGLDLMWLAD
jgi:HD-GYP domain-containing protein (c-di-GMP phosphodiesterase class II)